MSVVIKIENVSKQYRLGLIGTNTLKGDLQRWRMEEKVSSKKYVVSSTLAIAFSPLGF